MTPKKSREAKRLPGFCFANPLSGEPMPDDQLARPIGLKSSTDGTTTPDIGSIQTK